jgi:hypothetical protein
VPTAPTFSISPIAIPGWVVAAEALNAGFAESELIIAVAISTAESSLNAAAISPPASDSSRGYGLFQIEYPTHSTLVPGGTVNNLQWVIPAVNAKMAFSVYGSQGWNAWTTYQTGAYLGQMPTATVSVAQLKNKALAAKQDLAAYCATVSKDDTVETSPILLEGGLGPTLGSAANAAAEAAGAAAGSFTSLYQGYSGPESGNPLLRVVEIFLGAALLLVGLSKLSAPVTAPVAGAVKTASKLIP